MDLHQKRQMYFKAFNQLLDILNEEKAIFQENALEKLPPLVDKKNAALAEIESLFARLPLAELLDDNDRQSRELTTLIAMTHQAHRVNGQIIHSNLNATTQILSILQGSPTNNTTYSKTGKITSSHLTGGQLRV